MDAYFDASAGRLGAAPSGVRAARLRASSQTRRLARRANATVTVCHSRTKNLPEITRQADILVVAIGQAKFLKADMVKPGAVVIDVGINRTADGLVGDVDYGAVKEVASQITPVPGGVGPLTITMLLKNTLMAAKLQRG